MADALDLEPIKARDAAASSGPWKAKAYRVYADHDRIIAACWRPWGPVSGPGSPGSIEADVEFIAAARTDVPALVAEVEQLRADLRIANEATLVLLARAAEAEADAEWLRGQGAASATLAAAIRLHYDDQGEHIG